MKKILLIVLLATVAFTGCEKNIQEPAAASAAVNDAKYLTVEKWTPFNVPEPGVRYDYTIGGGAIAAQLVVYNSQVSWQNVANAFPTGHNFIYNYSYVKYKWVITLQGGGTYTTQEKEWRR